MALDVSLIAQQNYLIAQRPHLQSRFQRTRVAGSRDAAAARLAAELSEGIAVGSEPGRRVLVVACAESAEDVPPPLRRCFTHELPLEAPDEAQRLALLQGLLAPGRVDEGALAAAASQTAGLLPGDLRAVAADAAAAAVRSLLPWRVRAPGPTCCHALACPASAS